MARYRDSHCNALQCYFLSLLRKSGCTLQAVAFVRKRLASRLTPQAICETMCDNRLAPQGKPFSTACILMSMIDDTGYNRKLIYIYLLSFRKLLHDSFNSKMTTCRTLKVLFATTRAWS